MCNINPATNGVAFIWDIGRVAGSPEVTFKSASLFAPGVMGDARTTFGIVLDSTFGFARIPFGGGADGFVCQGRLRAIFSPPQRGGGYFPSFRCSDLR
jgi:hypothetical protein